MDAVKGLGESLQKLLGDEYDMVGFDPRLVSLLSDELVQFLIVYS